MGQRQGEVTEGTIVVSVCARDTRDLYVVACTSVPCHNLCLDLLCVYACVYDCVFVRARLCMCERAFVCIYIHKLCVCAVVNCTVIVKLCMLIDVCRFFVKAYV